MSAKPAQPAPEEKSRLNPLPPNVSDRSEDRLPPDVPQWKRHYSEYTKK